MRLASDQLKKLSISSSIFDRLVRWGWVDFAGRSKQWFDHQRFNHDAQFEEVRERKPKKQKFVHPSMRRQEAR
jgi:hypothetical protein